MSEVTKKQLQEYMSDPVNMHSLGLSYWVNAARTEIGTPSTLYIMVTYLSSMVHSLNLPEEDMDKIVDLIRKKVAEEGESDGDMQSSDTTGKDRGDLN